MVKSLSVEVDGPAKPGFGVPRRSYMAKDASFTTPPEAPEVTTVYELFEHGCRKFANHNAMGARDFIAIHTESKEVTRKVDGEDVTETKEWQYYELGHYKFIKFKELWTTVAKVASGLVNAGIAPKSRFSIYSRTSMEWMQTFLACASQSITVVTAYDTLGVEGLQSSIQEAETCGILTDKDNFATLLKTIKDCPTIKLIVYRDTDGKLESKDEELLEQLKEHAKVLSYTELVKLGEKTPQEPTKPASSDCACIMYTSGSTGKPKGVVLNHYTVVAGVAGATGVIPTGEVSHTDVFLSMLPLAHIFELTAELGAFIWGACLGYGNPKTASDVSMRNCAGDIRTLKPTAMVAVPALWESVKKGIVAKIEKESSLKQALFWKAFALKHKCRQWGISPPLIDSVIFKKIKEGTGGRLRYLLNGGAALSRDTRVFLDTVVAPCLMGYGLTETNAMAAIMSPSHFDFESTGELVPSITVVLRDCPEMGYEGKNNQGEVLIRGACVTPGYFKNDEETKKVMTDDGWFCTGDIGQFTENGAIQIIDRVKNLVKTLNGEYVALERLESLYRSNKYCSNLCVFADSDHAKPVAVVMLNEPAVQSLAESKGIEFPEHDVAEFAQSNKNIYNEIIKSIQQTGKECDLKPVEILPAVTFSHDEWTPQNGFVTSAQKVQRRKIQDANSKGLEAAFEKS